MKQIWILTSMLLFPWIASAQDGVTTTTETNQFKTEQVKGKGFFGIPENAGPMIGGYVEGTFRVGEVSNHRAWFTGGGVSMVIGQRVHLGFRAYGLLSGVRNVDPQSPSGYRYLELAYGGVQIEPVIYHGGWWSVNIPILFGAGVAGTHTERSVYDHWDYWDYEPRDWDALLIVEPGIQVDLRLHKALHLATGVHYRFTENTYLVGEGFPALNGFSAQMALRVGWY